MKILIIGSTGLLGQALYQYAGTLGHDVQGIARSHADISLDIALEPDALLKHLVSVKPDIIINAAALVNMQACENDADLAYRVNSRPAALLANAARQVGAYFIHISTDHFYFGDKDQKHDENVLVMLLNEYARTKYAAEQFTLTNPDALVVRTNIVGFRKRKGQPTFAEWVFNALVSNETMKLYDDFYTSSIDAESFSKAIFDLIHYKPTGVINLASCEVASKKQFIEGIAKKMGHSLEYALTSSVHESSSIVRADSLGLDVSKAEGILKYRLPTLDDVVNSLVVNYRSMAGSVNALR